MKPIISVLLPVRDGAATLGRALASLRVQTWIDWELIAVDDGSTDATAALLEAAARDDARVRLIGRGREGIVAALNAGLAEARGEFIARMDADDVAHPERLAVQVALLRERPELGLASCLVEFGGDRAANAGYALHVDWLNALVTPEQIALNRFVESPLAHPSVMFRRELVEKFGGYRTGDFPEDYELWLRWLDAGVRMAKAARPAHVARRAGAAVAGRSALRAGSVFRHEGGVCCARAGAHCPRAARARLGRRPADAEARGASGGARGDDRRLHRRRSEESRPRARRHGRAGPRAGADPAGDGGRGARLCRDARRAGAASRGADAARVCGRAGFPDVRVTPASSVTFTPPRPSLDPTDDTMPAGETEKHRRLKTLALAWAQADGFALAATEVRVPKSGYRADVAACSRGPARRTAVFECKQARADLLKDAHAEIATRRRLAELSERRTKLEELLAVHRPDLRRGEALWPEFDAWDFSGLEHRAYRALLDELATVQGRVLRGTKFSKMFRYRCADFLYLVMEENIFAEAEIPAGWGLLVRGTGELGDELKLVRRPAELDAAPAQREALLEAIALAGTRAINRAAGIAPVSVWRQDADSSAEEDADPSAQP